MNPISSASWNNTSCSTNTAATSASARGQPPEGVARACGPYITSEISVAPTGTDNNAIRYQRTGTRHRRLRRVRSATPARPDNAAVTRKAARPAPSDMKTPCNGRPNGKIAELTIGGIAAVTKPTARLISMKASTGCRATPRTEADAFMIRRSQMEGISAISARSSCSP